MDANQTTEMTKHPPSLDSGAAGEWRMTKECRSTNVNEVEKVKRIKSYKIDPAHFVTF